MVRLTPNRRMPRFMCSVLMLVACGRSVDSVDVAEALVAATWLEEASQRGTCASTPLMVTSSVARPMAPEVACAIARVARATFPARGAAVTARPRASAARCRHRSGSWNHGGARRLLRAGRRRQCAVSDHLRRARSWAVAGRPDRLDQRPAFAGDSRAIAVMPWRSASGDGHGGTRVQLWRRIPHRAGPGQPHVGFRQTGGTEGCSARRTSVRAARSLTVGRQRVRGRNSSHPARAPRRRRTRRRVPHPCWPSTTEHVIRNP